MQVFRGALPRAVQAGSGWHLGPGAGRAAGVVAGSAAGRQAGAGEQVHAGTLQQHTI